MIKYTANNLKKLESLFNNIGYIIRYEKGRFQSGYCILEDKKVVVVSKYFMTEAKMNCLLDILSEISFDEEKLDGKDLQFYNQLKEEEIIKTN